MNREVSVSDCKQYQRTNDSQLQYMPGAERHTKSSNQCLGPPSVQMSSLCRHMRVTNTKMLADKQRK